MKKKAALDVKGLLIHVSHYDPIWARHKPDGNEGSFDLVVAVDVVHAMAEAGMNLLVVDCADGVIYESHPELRRDYSIRMRDLRELADVAHAHGIDICPKLNFAKSGRNLHDAWMGDYADSLRWTSVMDKYYEVAADCIAELVAACRPKRFFHIGMDEDHHRSHAQYVDAIKRLRRIVKSHGLRTVVWNDSCHHRKECLAQVHADKCRAAEGRLPKDVVEVLWDYERCRPKIIRRIAEQGFDVWGAPGRSVEHVRRWRKALLAEGGSGILMTHWVKCDRPHRESLLECVRIAGEACS